MMLLLKSRSSLGAQEKDIMNNRSQEVTPSLLHIVIPLLALLVILSLITFPTLLSKIGIEYHHVQTL